MLATGMLLMWQVVSVGTPTNMEGSSSKTQALLVGGLAASAAWDTYTTRRVLTDCGNSCREANPIMRPFANSTPKLIGIKVGLNAVTFYGAQRLKKKGKGYWWVPMAMSIGVQSAAGTSNWILDRKVRTLNDLRARVTALEIQRGLR